MEYERVILVKPTVSIFVNIPSSGGGRGHRADHWDLTNPSWVGRVRVCTIGAKCVMKFEDKTTGDLFADCPVDNYPSSNIDPVIDSSRYFVIKIVNGTEHAFVGMGFDDRSDSFDLRVTLQEYFRQLQKEVEIKHEEDNPIPLKDYSLKEGQSIKIDFKGFKKTGIEDSKQESAKIKQAVHMSGGMLLPPPSAKKLPTPQQHQDDIPSEAPAAPPVSNDPFKSSDPFISTPEGQGQGQGQSNEFSELDLTNSDAKEDSGDGWVKF